MNSKKLLLVVFLILVIIFFSKSLFLTALVNGIPIMRSSVTKELEKQGGKKVLDSLIAKELINQEARKKGVTVKQSEVDAEIKKIEKNTSKQGQNLDQLLTLQGMTRDDLKNQLNIQLILQKLLADKIKVSDKEVDQYLKKLDTGESSAQKPPGKEQVKDQLKQQKLQKEAQALVESLKKSAKISLFVNY